MSKLMQEWRSGRSFLAMLLAFVMIVGLGTAPSLATSAIDADESDDGSVSQVLEGDLPGHKVIVYEPVNSQCRVDFGYAEPEFSGYMDYEAYDVGIEGDAYFVTGSDVLVTHRESWVGAQPVYSTLYENNSAGPVMSSLPSGSTITCLPEEEPPSESPTLYDPYVEGEVNGPLVDFTLEVSDPAGRTFTDWEIDQPSNGTVEQDGEVNGPWFTFTPSKLSEDRGQDVVQWRISHEDETFTGVATFQVVETITPPEPSFDPETGLLTLPAVDGLVYHVDGEPRQDSYQVCGTSVVEVFGADQWVELNGTTSWTYAYECDTPDPDPVVVTPTGPSVTQQPTCMDTDMVVTPSSQEGVVMTPAGSTTLAMGENVTYTASPADGYTFPEGVESEWSFINDFDDSQCDAPDPGPSVEFDRHPGENRYHTAALVSAEYSAETTRVAYVASGADQSMVDAIAGGPAAAAGLSPQVSGMATNQADVSAPVLLVRSGSVPGITHAALERFDNLETIVVLGGTEAISQNVTEELSQYGTVVRIAGDNRYETAALVAMLHGQSDRVYVASGADPSLSDALTAGALAGYQGHPVLLVRPNSVPQSFWTALAVLQPSEVVIVGGESAVSKVVSQEIGATDRLAGKDRYATAALVAAEFGPNVSRAFIATGLRFPDALAGSALAARDGGPVLLTRLESAPGATLGVFNGLDQLQRVTTLGGLNAVSENVVDQVRAVVNP